MNAYKALSLTLIVLFANEVGAQDTDSATNDTLGPGEVATVNGKRR